MQIVTVDIGGTHTRFAIAELRAGGAITLGEPVTLKTAEHASFEAAWQSFAQRSGRPLPRQAGIAVACPLGGDVLKLTNNPWTIRLANLATTLGLDAFTLVNDFGAIGHAVAQMDAAFLRPLCGPERPVPEVGVVSIIGPGTGLGVAQILRRQSGYQVIECEGGHVDFAPVDSVEDAILSHLRQRYGRVSIERIVSGPGLVNIHEALGVIEGRPVRMSDDKALWAAALAGKDPLAVAALERFCLSLGSVAGDIALTHGATAVVIAGGVGLYVADDLPRSGFANRFKAKGRFEQRMADIPVKLLTHPQPGLLGAAAAFIEEHGA